MNVGKLTIKIPTDDYQGRKLGNKSHNFQRFPPEIELSYSLVNPHQPSKGFLEQNSGEQRQLMQF